MTEAAKKARREYRKQWYEANRDKVKAYNERYWEKKVNAQNGTGAGSNTEQGRTGKGVKPW